MIELAESTARFLDSIGINTHVSYDDTLYGDPFRVVSLLRSLGITHIRDGEGGYRRLAMQTLGDAGMKYLLNVMPPYTALELQAAVSMIETSGKCIEAWEGQNEPDANDPNWRTNTITNFFALKAANTMRLPVVGPPLANAANAAFLSPMIATYGSLHSYPAGGNPSEMWASEIARIQPLYPGLPLMVTETGYHNALNDHSDQPGVDEATAAKYIPRLLLEAFNAGIYRTYLYELINTRPLYQGLDSGLASESCNWGLIDVDGREKPAFVALKNMLAILRAGMDEIGEPTALEYEIDGGTNIHQALLQKAPGVYSLILWQDVSSWDTAAGKTIVVEPQTISLSVKAKAVLLFDPLFSSLPYRTDISPAHVMKLMVWDRIKIVEVHTPKASITLGKEAAA